MKGELKKIFSEIHIRILILVIIILTIITPIMSLRSYDIVESAESTNTIKGKKAVRIMQERYSNTKGELHISKINQVLKYYQSIDSEDAAYAYADIKYPGPMNLLTKAYQPVNSSNDINLYQLENANDFYRQNIVQNKKLVENAANEYREWEKALIIKKSESIKKPFILDSSGYWVIAYKALSMLFLILAISAIITGTRVFAYEKEKKMDLILSTFRKSKLVKIGKNKIFALCSFLTGQYLISVTLFTIIFFSSIGFHAWSSQIQLEYFNSIYQLTFGGAYLLFIFIGWLCILTIGTLVSTINAFTQKALISLILGVIIVFIPLIITKLGAFPIFIKKFLQLQPVNGLLTEKCISSLQIYRFPFLDVLTTTAIIVYACILLIICFLIAPRLFRVRLNKA